MGYLKINNLYKDQRVLLFKEVYCMEKIHGCLHADSIINMADGSQKRIKEVQSGDTVISFNEESKKFVETKVKDVFVKEKTEFLDWYKLTLENGKIIVCTEDHPILTSEGWVQAKNLSEKDNIISMI